MTVAPRRAIGKVKFPKPQKKSATVSPGLRLEQADRAPHQHAIEACVHLREVRRLEFERQAEFGQPVGERASRRLQGLHTGRSRRLQVELHIVHGGEGLKLASVGHLQRCEDAKHQRINWSRAILADREFDLRQPVANRQPGDHARSSGSRAEMRGGRTRQLAMSAT